VKNLKVGASFDYLSTTDGLGLDHGLYANAWALYSSFQATEKLSLHLRGEYASTDTSLLGTDPALITSGNSKVFALTGTLQYDLWKNVLSRLEVRWDHLAGDVNMTGYGGKADGSTPGTKRNNVIIAANIIYKF